jgi:oligopeptidase A
MPLLAARTDDGPLYRYEEPPRFDLISNDMVVPAIRDLIARQDAALADLETSLTPGWAGLLDPLSRLGEPLGYAWNVVHHLLSVSNSPKLREAQETVEAEVVAAGMRAAQSQPIYRGLTALRDGAGWSALDAAQKRIVTLAIRNAELAGIGLEGAARERFNAIEAELAELGTRFSNNVLDATKAYALVLTTRDEVEGLPPSLLSAAAQAARASAEKEGGADERGVGATADKGPWRITLEAPSLIPFLEHSRRRDLRERIYRASIARASSGELDNQPLIERILRLRQEQAGLLGYPSYAALSLSRKMADEVPAVERLLGELHRASRPRALAELDDLTAFARTQSGDPKLTLALWDVPFWAERLREARYAYSDEALRPYFPLPEVLKGLFAIAHRLFGVTIVAADGEVPVWHPDTRFFRVLGENGAPMAAFYLDPYSRPADKRGGAWMNGCLDRKRRADASVRLPMAYLVCNQTPPVDGKPSLMTFDEVETLFHEFGHGLQHMLTQVDYTDVAGINNIEWDAVELPSQFMENWCYHRPTLLGLTRHYETGQPLADEVFRKIEAARTYRAGSQFLRQLYLATLDLELHHRLDPGKGLEGIKEIVGRVAAENTVIPPLPEDRFLCGFSHIFAGGYAAGYYSYKWAEVLAADAFAAFEEAGLEDPDAVARTGRRFRDTVLALGGSCPPGEVFAAFRGRAPTTAALLRQYGLAPTTAPA